MRPSPDGLKRSISFVRAAGHAIEIAAQRLESSTLLIDLVRSSEAEPPQDRDRRTPALDGMLKQEHRHGGRQHEPAAVSHGAKGDASKSYGSRIRLNCTFNVPFLV